MPNADRGENRAFQCMGAKSHRDTNRRRRDFDDGDFLFDIFSNSGSV